MALSGSPRSSRSAIAAAAVWLVALSPAAAQTPNPPQSPDAAAAVGALFRNQIEFGAAAVTLAFKSALLRSRDSARANSRPLPAEVRAKLGAFYPAELLDKVRYTVGDPSNSGLAGFAIREGDAAAVTLIDTVVFREERYAQNAPLWAHELRHVQQFGEWGVDGFAYRYAFGWPDVEADARAFAAKFVAEAKGKG